MVLRDLVEILPRLETTIDVSPTRLRHTAERLIGRDEELTRLDAAWNDSHTNVVIVRAFGGMGKTSLVATWMAELAMKDWRGAERVFDWSFYSQGTSDQRAASADTFVSAALTAFGDPDPTLGSAWDRGARLAHLIGKQRCLLVLDGLEPLQYPPGPMEGKLKDAAIETLLKGLAAHNDGLCVVTTREKVPDIRQYYGRTAVDLELIALSEHAGAALLHHHGARRAGAKRDLKPDAPELRTASRELRGHGLTLQLLGQYLRLVEDGDILKRDTVRLRDADREYQNDATRSYGHAFKAMEAYERWFQREGDAGQRQLAILRLLGLFDRPASKDCLDALRTLPVIPALTESIVGLTARDWTLVTKRLEEINLLSVQEDGSFDAHPLLREYFSQRLRETQPETWRAAHGRIYRHLCDTAPHKAAPTLEDLQPLYQAVVHGCLAGLHEEVCETVFAERVQRGAENYASKKLGAYGSELAAVACFFESPWDRPSPRLTDLNQAWLLAVAAYDLWALGRLVEARAPMRAGLEARLAQEDWQNAAISVGTLSQLKLILGELDRAIEFAEQEIVYADRSGHWFQRSCARTRHADALHQVGRRPEAEARFREASEMQAIEQPQYPLLYSVRGTQLCDQLLTDAERAAWRAVTWPSSPTPADVIVQCRAVQERATTTLAWVTPQNWLLDIASDQLTIARAAFYETILASSPFLASREAQEVVGSARSEFDSAVEGLRRAGIQQYLPAGLLARAWQRRITGARGGPASAQSDLDEAWEIAERGPMPLVQADIHLHRARLFGLAADRDTTSYPWESVDVDLAEARRLIEKHGYWRRKEELEDAEAALKQLRAGT